MPIQWLPENGLLQPGLYVSSGDVPAGNWRSTAVAQPATGANEAGMFQSPIALLPPLSWALAQYCVEASLTMVKLLVPGVTERLGSEAERPRPGGLVVLSEHAANTSAPAATASEENVVTIRRIHTPMGER